MRKRLTTIVACAFLVSLFVAGVSAVLTDLKITGSGRFESNCIHTLLPGCTTTASGQMSGTPVNPGSWALRFDLGGPILDNGSPGTTQGACLTAVGPAQLTESGGDTINLNTVGIVCEEGEPSSPYHYSGTYRITGGTGRFAAATGGGDVSATFTREGTFTRGAGDALFLLDGTIVY